MAHWIRFKYNNAIHIGIENNYKIDIYDGDMFNTPVKQDTSINKEDITLLNPCKPS